MAAPRVSQMGGGIAQRGEDIGASTRSYVDYFEGDNDAGMDAGARKANYTDVVNKYYDLATSFYEYGWGTSFHFAHRYTKETLKESLTRHEHYLALKLQLKKGYKVLDVGCGVGGPLRCIAGFSGAAVTGLNNNAYQITRGEQLNAATGHHGNCRYVKGDFMDMGALGAGTFDCAYQIEATCHAPDLRGVLSQIFKSLKPGGLFASYEWCMTGRYQVGNKAHEQIKHDILLGNGLPDLYTTEEVVAALKDVGFEILEAGDLAASSEVAWYEPIDATSFVSITNFRTSRLGRAVTHAAVWALETLKVAPRGTSAVSGFLVKGADALVAGGRADLFTPMFFTLSRKPLAAAPAGPSGLTAQTGRAQAVEAGEEVERVVPRSATHSRRSAQ